MVQYTNAKQRATALMMVVDGRSAAEIAEVVGVTPRTANRWKELYRNTGILFPKLMTPYNATKLTPWAMEVKLKLSPPC